MNKKKGKKSSIRVGFQKKVDRKNNEKNEQDLIFKKPFVSQYYWNKNWLNEWSMAFYYGPRIKWMQLYESGKIKRPPTN